MTTTISRRDVLGLLGGIAMGTVFSPAPWKLLDDLAIRTQNEGWVAHPRRGRRQVVSTRCAACSRGCAVNVQCIDGRPVAVLPRPGVPRTGFCAFGAVLHHASAHSRRLRGAWLREARRGRREIDPELAADVLRTWIASARNEGSRAVLLQAQPHRPAERALRRAFASLGVTACAAPTTSADLARMGSLVGASTSLQWDWDLGRAQHVLALGGPLDPALDAQLPAHASVVSAASIPASRPVPGHRWLEIRPGSEDAFALALLLRLRGEHPAVRDALDRATGVGGFQLDRLALALRMEESAVVPGHDPGSVGPSGETLRLVTALNHEMGAIGPTLRARQLLPWPWPEPPTPLLSLDDEELGEVSLILVDATDAEAELGLESLLRRHGSERTRVVAFSPYDGELARGADLALGVRAPLESNVGLAAGVSRRGGDFAVARALRSANPGCLDRLDFARRVVADVGDTSGVPRSEEKCLELQLHALANTPEATIRNARGVAPCPSASELREELEAGAVWDSPEPTPFRIVREVSIDAGAAERALEAARVDPGSWPVLCTGEPVIASGCPLPPLFSKLSREGGLLRREGEVWVAEATAKRSGWKEGSRLRLVDGERNATLRVRLASDLPQGRLLVPRGLAAGCFGDGEAAAERANLACHCSPRMHVEVV